MGKRRWGDRMASIKFDRDVRFAMAAACETAIAWGYPAVLPVHLLYGLADQVPDLLPEFDRKDPARGVRRQLEAKGVRPGRSPKPIPYSNQLLRILAVAREAAFRADDETVTAGHLVAALRSNGDDACAALLKGAKSGGAAAAHELDLSDLSWIALSDESDAPYHQQLADRIRDAIASGRLLPGQSLPTVRRLAEVLDLAPGTVARAYKALDVAGVVETAGSKGTTVALPKDGGGDPEERTDALVGLLRPVVVAAFHMGATAEELSLAVMRASEGVLTSPGSQSDSL
jgi:GntR family transcriptional regulator